MKLILVSILLLKIVNGYVLPNPYVGQYVKQINSPFLSRSAVSSYDEDEVIKEKASKPKIVHLAIPLETLKTRIVPSPVQQNQDKVTPKFTNDLVEAFSNGVSALSVLGPVLGIFDNLRQPSAEVIPISAAGSSSLKPGKHQISYAQSIATPIIYATPVSLSSHSQFASPDILKLLSHALKKLPQNQYQHQQPILYKFDEFDSLKGRASDNDDDDDNDEIEEEDIPLANVKQTVTKQSKVKNITTAAPKVENENSAEESQEMVRPLKKKSKFE